MNRAGEPLCPMCDSAGLVDEERWQVSQIVMSPLQEPFRYYACGGCGFLAMFKEDR